jgi:DNA-directed RNA polymerase sigma subunit (sigma70/sigma32)
MKMTPKAKAVRIDLGLDILRATRPGEHTCEEIAAYADLTPNRVRQIERAALAKLRRELSRIGIASTSVTAI